GVEPNGTAAAAFLEGCKDRGLLVGKGGLYGNVARLTPMLNVSESELDEGIDIMIDVINSIEG
ncbi:MAG: 4-aminobutyrate aminotransferase, partial [Candidatus Poriferisodalaceae bacterium]